MKKAQISMEAIAAVGLLFLVLLILIGIVVEKRVEIFKAERFIEGRTECIKLSNLISEAYVQGEGIIISDKIKFNASIIPESRLISVNNREEVFCTVPIFNISKVDLIKGNIRIKNINNTVIIENV
jgi:hypothetical protein